MNILLDAVTTSTTDATAASTGGSMIGMILIYVVFFAVLWFFMMRPQKKEQKRVAAMLANLATGDVVLTTSGFYGVVIDINEDMVIVEFGSNKNCRIPMEKGAISRVEKQNEA